MIGKSKVIAIIPARGGSKRLPGKNIINICGKPLIAYTIMEALKSRYIDRIIVSTDDKKIASIAKRFGAQVPFMRPKKLARNTSHTTSAIKHAIKFLESKGERIDFVVTLQPTSPLRSSRHIDEAIALLHNSRFDSVLSVKEADFPPYWLMRINGKRMLPFVDDGTDYFRKVRQQLPKVYQPNGAVYVTKRNALFRERAVIARNCGVIVMDRWSSLDIDTHEDLEMARKKLKEVRRRKDEKK